MKSPSLSKMMYRGRVHVGCAILLSITINAALSGCATWQKPAEFDDSALRSRAVSEEIKGVRLSATVLSRKDSMRMLGVKLDKEDVQPIWIEVNNSTDQVLWLLQSGTDPDIFSPREVAWPYHRMFSSKNNTRLDEYFTSLVFQNPIAPQSTRSGIIFTNPYYDIRLLNVDLLGRGDLFPFTLFLPIPDDPNKAHAQSIASRMASQTAENYQDGQSFRTRLEQLPCCASSSDGTTSGDPINVILVGNFEDIGAATVRRGFRITRFAFDNDQYLYGRPPDVVIRKSSQNGAPAIWLRGWAAPFRYQGKAVILAQAGRPIGGRFIKTKASEQMLHPNVDEIRNFLIGDMMYSGGLDKLGFVTGVGKVNRDKPKPSLNGASYYTDGLRVVMFFVTRPRTISDIKILDWYPALKIRERDAVRNNENP